MTHELLFCEGRRRMDRLSVRGAAWLCIPSNRFLGLRRRNLPAFRRAQCPQRLDRSAVLSDGPWIKEEADWAPPALDERSPVVRLRDRKPMLFAVPSVTQHLAEGYDRPEVGNDINSYDRTPATLDAFGTGAGVLRRWRHVRQCCQSRMIHPKRASVRGMFLAKGRQPAPANSPAQKPVRQRFTMLLAHRPTAIAPAIGQQ